MTLGMHLCSACNRRTTNALDDDDDDCTYPLSGVFRGRVGVLGVAPPSPVGVR